MAKHENNPDGGYDHFHESGRKSPHDGKLVQSIGEKRAMNSGPGGLGKGPSGTMPVDKGFAPVQRNVPGGSESE